MPESPFPEAPTIAVDPAVCGLCGSAEAEPYADSFDYEYASCANAWRFVRCAACGCVYLNPRPRADVLRVIYPPTYYSYHYDAQVNRIARAAKAWLDARRFRAIRRQLDIPLGAYLDIGCGNGRYLHAMAAAGLPKREIYGTELDATVARSLADQGFQVQAAPFEEAAGLPERHFALITLFSVLEHMAAPRAALERARALLCTRGLVVFEIPNIDSLNARLFRRLYWGGYHTPRHWNLFSVGAIERAARSLDFELAGITRTTGHAFWLWSLHHYARYELGWDRLGRALNPSTCLPGVALATVIDMIRASLSMQTDNMIVTLRKPS